MKKYFYGLLFLSILQSCSQKDFATKYNFADKTAPSKKYVYTLTNTSVIVVDAPNNKMETTNTSTVSFAYQMAFDSTANKIITITFDKFLIKIKKNDEDAEIYNSEM